MTILLNIDVPSLVEGERFYAGAFGLRPARHLGETVLEMHGWPAPLYLLEKGSGTVGAADQLRTYERHWTPVHIDVVVSDIRDALERALDCGATIERDVTETAFGQIAMLADPFGHGFCLIEFSAQGYDAIEPVSAA